MNNLLMNALGAAGASATEHESPEVFQQRLDAMLDQPMGEPAATVLERLSDIGGVELAVEDTDHQQARKTVQAAAISSVRDYVSNYQKISPDYHFPNGRERAFSAALVSGGDPAKDDEINRAFLKKLNSDNPELKHEAFLELMDRFSQVDPEAWSNLTDAQLAEQAKDILPVANLAFEGQSIFAYFKEANIGITPEEEQRWQMLAGKIGEVTGVITSRINMMCSPYYPEVDASKFPSDPVFWDDCVNQFQGTPDDYISDATIHHNAISSVAYTNGIINGLAKDNVMIRANVLQGFSEPSFNNFLPNGERYDRNQFERDALSGKPIYIFDANVVKQLVAEEKQRLQAEAQEKGWSNEKLQKELADNEGILDRLSKANQDKFYCVQDLAGNGVYVQVPKPVEKPNGLIRFFHAINKFFGGDGLTSCNQYEQYENEMTELRAKAQNMSPFEDFKKAAEDQKALKAQKDKTLTEVSDMLKKSKEADKRFLDFLGTEPKHNQKLLDIGVYEKPDLDMTKYTLPKGSTNVEFATVAFAALADKEVSKDLRDDVQGLSDEEKAERNYNNLTEDLLYNDDANSRKNSGKFLKAYAKARSIAFEALDAFYAGDMKPMAKLFRESIAKQVKSANPCAESYRGVNYQAAKYLERELKMLEQNPELFDLALIPKEQLKNARGIVKLGNLYGNFMESASILQDALVGKEDLYPADEQKHVEDMLLFQVIEQMERKERAVFAATDPECQRLEKRMAEITEAIPGETDRKKQNDLINEVQVLQDQRDQHLHNRPQSLCMRAISDPVHGDVAMEQLRQKIRESSVMQEMNGKNLLEKLAHAKTEVGSGQLADKLYKELFTAKPAAKGKKLELEKAKERQRSNSMKQPNKGALKMP